MSSMSIPTNESVWDNESDVKLERAVPLDDFQRNAATHLAGLRETGLPSFLTVDGQAVVVIQDVAAYERLLADLDRAEAIAEIRVGLEQADRGEGRPLCDALAEQAAKHGIRLES